MKHLAQLELGQLQRLLRDVTSNRLADLNDVDAISRSVGEQSAADVGRELIQIHRSCGQNGVAIVLEALVAQCGRLTSARSNPELVWSGPDLKGTNNRDTGTVVRSLFRSAEREVILAGYAIYAGRDIFAELAKRMDELEGLHATFLLDVRPDKADPAHLEASVARYLTDFRLKHWPGLRIPQIYYDPRAFEGSAAARAAVHAKFVIVDSRQVFVSSANFTPAAQDRNIEVGVLLDSPEFAGQLRDHVQRLIDGKFVHRAV
jgi:phosphatidylserine/phosphatidylglycerophosphate/cardiolipin synthase-like enzyme